MPYQCYDYEAKKLVWQDEPCDWGAGGNPFEDPEGVWEYWGKRPDDPDIEAYTPPSYDWPTYPYGEELPGDLGGGWSPGAAEDPTPLVDDPFPDETLPDDPTIPDAPDGNGGMGAGLGVAAAAVGALLLLSILK